MWLILAVAKVGRAVEANLVASALESIHVDQIRQHVGVLADDTMEGRHAGRAGGRAAATYIMRALKQAGLQPGGLNGTYFQPLHSGCRNILAIIEGADPELRHETILLSAHYDHVGYGSRKTSMGVIGAIHNGADDNASGVSAVLEAAEALQQSRTGLARSVLIAFWDGEEQGLWGSKHWLSQPTTDPQNLKLMVNVDMVGRLRGELSLFGTRSLPGLRYAWSQANTADDLHLEFPWPVLDNSDHYPFLQRGIPITMVHTGLHAEYHTPRDDEHLLNYEGIRQATRLVVKFVMATANRDSFPKPRPASILAKKAAQREYERPFQPQSTRQLGITLQTRADGTLMIESVTVGQLANHLGLKPGEEIRLVDGRPPASIDEFRRLVQSQPQLQLNVGRNGVYRDVLVALGQKRQRVGLSWKTNIAEPHAVTISSVTQGTPADRAGLRHLDRIYEINGTPLVDADDFRSRMQTLVGTVEMVIERAGRLQVVQLDLPPVEQPDPIHFPGKPAE